MEKQLYAILLFCSMIMAMPMVHGIDESPQAVEKWFQSLSMMKEKVTKLHFYFSDQVSGKNNVRVARANNTFQSSTFFGLITVINDALTVGPEPNSLIVGRAQGTFTEAGLEKVGTLMTLNFVFTSGEYNGSTLSVLGRYPLFNLYRELPIVGGSGVFRLARGIATSEIYSFNTATGDAIVEYNVTVRHY
ncbi:dirigent protein 23-like [Rhododendron vialii]|uniref:dirigent protein 23-like n=1 Tax=Rhododendron vialii TaxID=182163 RepID=UPI00265EFD17|nr:dirigent protein 23-like [Rhododendron vialii]